MRTRLKPISPETALLRILDALAQEVIAASDSEITQAATALRMDLNSRGSAAFAGLTYFARPQLSDFFEIEVSKVLQAPAKQVNGRARAQLEGKRRSKQARIPLDRKPPSEK